MISQKEKLRLKYKRLREKIPAAAKKSASRRIARKFFLLPEVRKAKTIGIYIAKGPEAGTLSILRKLLTLKKKAAAPKVGPKHQLNFYQIRGLKDCKKGAFEILEPKSRCPLVSPKDLDLILVPGIVFDREGYRLGYGKGFYDRFLKKNSSLLSIGLSYERTYVPKVPHDRKDVPVSIVLTDKAVHRV